MKLQENVKTSVNKRNSFDLSFDGVLSQNWGDLVPIVCKEMVPGDTFNCDASAFVRLTPLASPTYGRIHGYINYFFVPNRILMANDLWEDFIRGGVDGLRTYSMPYIMAGVYRSNSVENTTTGVSASMAKDVRKLATYLGLPDPSLFTSGLNFMLSALPIAAYNRIYGDYYFPWSVEDDADVEALYFKKLTTGSLVGQFTGNSLNKWLQLKHACFKKDYLTTAQTRSQRGKPVYTPADGQLPTGSMTVSPDNVTPDSQQSGFVSSLALRWANSIQRFLEKNNIAGARYFEQILARFGISIPAERLQRSEYIGGTDFWIKVADVTSAADTTNGDNGASLGALAGKGVGLGQGNVSYTAQDYGFFVAILHIMPESGCPQGLNRMWFRRDRLDYFTPEMEDTGMQPIYNVEVCADMQLSYNYTSPSATGVFGYIPRYAEYKFSPPLLAGDFRLHLYDSQATTIVNDMASMHLYRLYGISGSGTDIPVLNSEWLTLDNEKVGTFNRIFQDTNTDFDHFWTNIQVHLTANRPMMGYLETSSPFQIDEHHSSISVPAFGVRL